ncbi:methyltransferase domain-containing protein [Thermogymnomonas acidicola]|uniref:methyltransferase domain-containing protein n=1 Tax=Thermogymnomonas acidicola TaxID=399579 RepID=UPI00094639D7|nr:methyltransferase domain-containing protein [Thermogymnomonas acidicola]
MRSGSRVLESGVGSGALSAVLLSIIGPSGGRLVSADTDAQAISLARSNSSRFTDADNWELVNSDIHSVQRGGDGFDAVFLDLPQPWDYLERASELCRPGGMVVCYSPPTYNQVERTLEASRDTHLMLVESCTLRKENIIVRPGSTRPDNNVIGHTGFISFYIRLSGMELQSF